MRTWEELSINDSLQEECSKLESFLSTSHLRKANEVIDTRNYTELALLEPMKKKYIQLGCKRVRLTKRKYTKEPLRKITESLACKDHKILVNIKRFENAKFSVTRTNIATISSKKEIEEIYETRILELPLFSKRLSSQEIHLKVNPLKLHISRESLKVKDSIRITKMGSLVRKEALKLPFEPMVLKLEKPKLTKTKCTIIANLALFQDPDVTKLLQEFCTIYERENECNVPIIQSSSNTSIALLKHSSIINTLPNWVTDAVILCTEEEKIPSRHLLEFLYSMRVKVFFVLNFDSLRILLNRSAEKASYLSETETAHERLLTRGLGISNFKAQQLLSVKPLTDILIVNKSSSN